MRPELGRQAEQEEEEGRKTIREDQHFIFRLCWINQVGTFVPVFIKEHF